MNKSILVIDTPSCCNECKIRFDDEYSNWCPYDNPEPNGVFQYVKNGTKPDWCPLKQLPKKIDFNGAFEAGYNWCINDILGANK